LSGQTPAGINNSPPALLLGIRAEVSISLSAPETVETANVFGFLPGSDPVFSQQIIILGAHYDHVGNDPDRAYSGANDNASGISVMLEIARLWHTRGYRPKRSVLFVAWGAQELGELGSRYYIENPLYPLEDTVTTVQMDAVGGGEGYHLLGEGTRKDEGLLLFSLEKAKDLVGGRLYITLPDESGEIPPEMLFSSAALYDRTSMHRSSDYVPFRSAGIPSLLITWRESDENNLSDELADEIEPDKLYTTGKMTALTLMMIAR
jgi:Zn-dependent M28 family amino/carboxypeptidase